MPSARLRFAGEAALLVLVALGLALARFDPLVIGIVMLLAAVLVALLERASAKAAARGERHPGEPSPEPPPHVERAGVPETPTVEVEAQAEPSREPAVNERGARAILVSASPPLPPEPAKPAPKPQREPVREPEPEPTRKPRRRVLITRSAPPSPPPEPEPAPVVAEPPREWNLWELERAVRDAAEDERREEWSALLIHLREFANAGGDLPVAFDGLVRESFAELLAGEPERAAAS